MCKPNDAPGGKAGKIAGISGFTLLELMISMALLAIVLMLVYGGFSQISDGALELRDELTEEQELRLLMRMVADDLQSVQWLARFWEKGVGHDTGIMADTIFEEGKDFSVLSFHSAQPARFYRNTPPEQDPGLHEVGYRARKPEKGEGEGMVLERREDFYLDNDLENGGLEVVLATGLSDFLVEFLPADADPNALTEPWEKRWNSPAKGEKTRMPKAIRLTIGRKDAAGKEYRQVLEFNLREALKL